MKVVLVFALVLQFLSFEQTRITLSRNERTIHELVSSSKKLERALLKSSNDDDLILKLREFSRTQYYASLSIGSPEQKFTAIFDTGSADLWVPSYNCTWIQIQCIIHNRFNGKKSSTYKSGSKPFELHYGTGSVAGIVSQDTVTLGKLRIKDQFFGEASQMSFSPFIGAKFDGILGLGFPSLSAFKVNPVFVNLFKQNPKMYKTFSFYLNTNKTSSFAGEIEISSVASGRFKAPLNTHKVVHNRYWGVKMDHITSKSVKLCSESCVALIDSGTSLLVGPSLEVSKLNRKLGFTPLGIVSTISCSKVQKLPDIVFTINGIEYTLSANDYVVQIMGLCISGFTGMDLPPRVGLQWILGDIFMRKYYSVFDMEKRVIHLAESIPT